MPNVSLLPYKRPSTFRRLAPGTWRTAYDPSVYGTLEVRMDEALRYLDAFRERTGKKLTLNHVMAKACGLVLRDVPEANAILRFGRVYQRKTVGVFFQVALEKESASDLSGLTIHDVDVKSLAEIHDEFQRKVDLTRSRRDPEIEPTRRRLGWVPGWLVGPVLDLISFLIYSLNLNLSWAGVPRDAFGSIMITNVGSLGLDIAYAPLVPYTRVPIIVALGAVHDGPIVEDGRLVVAKLMRVNVTFDHRFIDGVHAAKMARLLRGMIEQPFEHFGRMD
jgi:pyruvate dehydrogenase E2 component (dihydrolipoamide acetyltransferase)